MKARALPFQIRGRSPLLLLVQAPLLALAPDLFRTTGQVAGFRFSYMSDLGLLGDGFWALSNPVTLST